MSETRAKKVEMRRRADCYPDLLAALEAGRELWGWLPFDSGEDIQQAAAKVRNIQRVAIAKAKLPA